MAIKKASETTEMDEFEYLLDKSIDAASVKELFDNAVEFVANGEKMWKSGILGVFTYPNQCIHLSESTFFSLFGDRKDIRRNPFSYDESKEDVFVILENGVRVECLVEREVIE